MSGSKIVLLPQIDMVAYHALRFSDSTTDLYQSGESAWASCPLDAMVPHSLTSAVTRHVTSLSQRYQLVAEQQADSVGERKEGDGKTYPRHIHV